MAQVKTFNGLVIEWKEDEGSHLVTLTGDRTKVLYEGPNFGEASNVYTKTVAHYKAREKAET